MLFLLLEPSQVREARRAFRLADGLPLRGAVHGPVSWEPPLECEQDPDGDPLPTPGWTTDNLPAGDDDGEHVAIEVPDRLEHLSGTILHGVQLPAFVAEEALPASIVQIRDARRRPVSTE